MPEQNLTSGALPASINGDIIGIVLNYILTLNSNLSPENVPAAIRDFLQDRFNPVVNPEACLLITFGLVFCFLSLVCQLSWFTIGLKYSKLSNSHWVVRSNELGVLVPNTRFLMAILSVIFTLLLVCETILLILDINGISTLKHRTIIAGIKWLPLWLSSWVFSWGMGSSIYTTYSQIPKGVLGRLVGCQRSALVFNAIVCGTLTLAIIYETTTVFYVGYTFMARLDSFHRIYAQFEMMAAHYDPANLTINENLLMELPGLLDMIRSFEDWRQDFCLLLLLRLAWFLEFICICLPLYYIYFRLIHDVKKLHSSTSPDPIHSHSQTFEDTLATKEAGCYVQYLRRKSPLQLTHWSIICSDFTILILAAISSLCHLLVEVTVTIRFVYLFETSGNVSAQVALSTKTAVITNFIFAFTGLLSSWIFFNRSRLNYYQVLSYVNEPIHVERHLVTSDLFDTWTIATTIIMGDILSLPEVKKQESYFPQVRPQLKRFPKISSTKQFCYNQETGDVDHSI